LYRSISDIDILTIPEVQLQDNNRKKKLEIRITVPRKVRPYPVLVLSHGLGRSKNSLRPLAEAWARKGYVVLQPTHSDSMQYADAQERRDFVLLRNRNVSDWQSRPADVSFVLNELEHLEARFHDLRGKLDNDRIGVGGHSFGAHTTMLLGGATTRGFGARRSFVDHRVDAFLLISPQGKSALFDSESWKTCAKPMMTISGSEDKDPFSDRDAEWRKDPFRYSPAGEKFLVWISGAHHGFGGINGPIPFPSSGTPDPRHVEIVTAAGIAFWDAYLKQSKPARTWLRNDVLFKASKGIASVTAK